MSQLLMTQPSERTATIRVSLIALAVTAMCFSGCAHMYENAEMGKTSLPPHYPHPFEAPVNYGYFPTLWRAWPGAESIPGQTATSNKDEEGTQGESTSETLPEPSTETAPESGVEPGMENVFDLPEGMQNEAPQGDDQPNMEPLPDQLIPPQNEAPAATEEPQQPAAAPEVEQLPDQLIPPDEGAAPPPESSTMHEPRDLEELPFDAPEGDLIPETAQPVAAKPRPGLLMPIEPRRAGDRQPPRIENAMRPGARQGAKVMLAEPENALRELAGNKVKAAPTAADAFADGPQLMTPVNTEATVTASRQETPKAETSTWQSTRSAGKRASMMMPMAVTATANANATADEPADTNWRPSRGRGKMQGPALQATAANQPNRTPRQAVTREYPTMQVGHTENVMRDDASDVGATSGAANPLR